MKLPSGPGAPAPDITDILAQATRTCRGIRTFTAEIAVSGSVGASRTRGRLAAGLAAPASARLEAVAPFGEPLFIFAATGNDATLLLPRDRRVLEHGPPDEVLEAIAGVPLGAADLRATLTGCTTGERWTPTAAAERALRGLEPAEAANLTALLCGIPVADRQWALREINQLLFLRELRQTGRFGPRDGRNPRPN